MSKLTKAAGVAKGQCHCGHVSFEIDVPARWAWHDHSGASRRAHGAAYATYVGSWRKRFRITRGESEIARFEPTLSFLPRVITSVEGSAEAASLRSLCSISGSFMTAFSQAPGERACATSSTWTPPLRCRAD